MIITGALRLGPIFLFFSAVTMVTCGAATVSVVFARIRHVFSLRCVVFRLGFFLGACTMIITCGAACVIFAALRCVQTRLFSGRVHHDYYRCVKTRTDFSFFFRCHHGYVRCCDGECCFCAYSPRIFALRCVQTRTDFCFFFPLSPWLRAVLRR